MNPWYTVFPVFWYTALVILFEASILPCQVGPSQAGYFVINVCSFLAWLLPHLNQPFLLRALVTFSRKLSLVTRVWSLGVQSRNSLTTRRHTAFSSVQFSRSVVSHSLRPHELQHARAPCPSPSPGVHSDSCPLSRWCHPAISSSVVPFSSCPQSLPASESFPMSQLFAWGGQSTGFSALASVLPKNTQDWSPLE